jgi:copper homeostasis protein
MVQKAKLEIACFNLESAVFAQENGANRVELCDGFEFGGTTPDIETIQKASQLLTIDLYVMIRPRGGNFVYSEEEFSQMKASIQEFKKQNGNGFVFGILNQDYSINKTQNKELVELAKPFPCTFHRAFDEVSDAFQSVEEIIDCGFQTILTSGQAQNVVDGIDQLSELVKKANNRIVIMPGGGLRSSNIGIIQQKTKANWFHSSAITDGKETANPNEITALQSKLK